MPKILNELSPSKNVIEPGKKQVLFKMIIPSEAGKSATAGARWVINIQELELDAVEATAGAFLLRLLYGGGLMNFRPWPRKVVVVDTNQETRIRYYFDASYADVVALFRQKKEVAVTELFDAGAEYLGRRILSRDPEFNNRQGIYSS